MGRSGNERRWCCFCFYRACLKTGREWKEPNWNTIETGTRLKRGELGIERNVIDCVGMEGNVKISQFPVISRASVTAGKRMT